MRALMNRFGRAVVENPARWLASLGLLLMAIGLLGSMLQLVSSRP
jgi:hypothetical protein